MKTLFLAVVCVSVGAAAQGVPSDRQALRVDARERRDDRRDAVALEVLLARFDAARARNDRAALDLITRELKMRVNREVVESKVEVLKDAREVRQDRRELVGDQVRGKPAADDRRDLRDDRRDLAVEAASLGRVKAIDVELAGLVGKSDVASLNRTRALMVELIGMGWNELGRDRRETREDRRELREDRRN